MWPSMHLHRRCLRASVPLRSTCATSTCVAVLVRRLALVVSLQSSVGCSAQRPPPGPLETVHFGPICPSELVAVERPVHSSALALNSVRDPLVPHDRFLFGPPSRSCNVAQTCDRDVAVRRRLDRLLDVFEEPALVRDGCRFVTAPSFGALSMGRIVNTGTEAIVTLKVAERAPGHGRLFWRRLIRVSNTDFHRFEDAVARAGFWNMTSLAVESPQQDGVQLYLECRRGEQHHLVSRASGVVESLSAQIASLGGCAGNHPP